MGLPPQEQSWYRQLGTVVKARSSPKISEQAPVQPEGLSASHPGDVLQEPRQWCAFELADQMEQGIAPGLTSRFVEPFEDEPPAEGMLRVQRRPHSKNKNQREYLLMNKYYKPLLLAVASPSGKDMEIFIAKDGEPPAAQGPAFSLQSQKTLNEWVLCSTRCEHCATLCRRNVGQRVLARIFHYTESVGEGQALCMDVDVPAPSEEGGSAVWCSVCGESQQDEASVASLTSRRPRWSAKLKTLTLDFRGRCSMSSSKNFQLEVPSERGQKPDVRLLFGKVNEDQFVLDYKRPLGIVQAFAAALTASHWK